MPSFSGHALRQLAPNTAYVVYVQCLEGGRSAARGAELVAVTAPSVPTGLEVADTTNSSILLRRRPVRRRGGVRRRSAALSFAKVYAGTETRCEISGLTHGKEYGFRVCAMHAHGGASDFSTELIARCEAGSASSGRCRPRARRSCCR